MAFQSRTIDGGRLENKRVKTSQKWSSGVRMDDPRQALIGGAFVPFDGLLVILLHSFAQAVTRAEVEL